MRTTTPSSKAVQVLAGMPKLAKGVGWEPPQASASQPNALPSSSAKKRKTEPEPSKSGTQPLPKTSQPLAKRQKTDRKPDAIRALRYDELKTEEHKVRWLLASIEYRGDREDYRSQPQLHKSSILLPIWNKTNLKADKGDKNQSPETRPVTGIQIGQVESMQGTKKNSTAKPSGLKIARIVRESTGSQAGPSKQASHSKQPGPSQPSTLTPSKVPSQPNVTPSLSKVASQHKAPVIFSRKKVEALRQKQAEIEEVRRHRDNETDQSRSSTPLVVPHQSAASNHQIRASPTFSAQDGRSSPPPVQALFEQLDHDEDDEEPLAEPVEVEVTHRAKRKEAQLRLFGVAQPLVRWVVEMIRVRMITVYGWPDFAPATKQPLQACAALPVYNTLLDEWIGHYWVQANTRLWRNRPPQVLEDRFVRYIMLKPTQFRNSIKQIVEPKIAPTYGVRRGNDRHKTRIDNFILDDKFLSPNLQDDIDRYKHEIIADTIQDRLFRGRKSFGYKHRKQLAGAPTHTIAFFSAIIRWVLQSFKFTDSKQGELEGNRDAAIYEHYVTELSKPTTVNRIKNHWADVMVSLLLPLQRSSDEDLASIDWGSDEDLDEDKQEAMNNLIGSGSEDEGEEVGNEEEEEEEADIPNTGRGKGKGKGKARAD
ncbi:hypothetical protein FRC09_000266 [Ceratobasidium sp. 395]|nr:hypothetical protein FRC09_000266 [Ceratobasidium sp. 395]